MSTLRLLGREIIAETDTLIGVVLSICGNILISFALNIQKLAHNRLSDEQYNSSKHSIVSSESRRSSNSSCSDDTPGTQLYSDTQIKAGCLECGGDSDTNNNTRYLRSKVWWLGIILLGIGESGNFIAYGFAPASTIAPLGTTTLISNTILAPLLLDETFRKQDFFGVLLAMLGAAGVVSSTKHRETKLSPELVAAALIQPRSIVFYLISGVLIVLLTALSPKYGSKNILIDLGLVALYGAYTVIATKSLSSMLNITLYKLFTYAISYILLAALFYTAILQIKYLNKAMQRYDSTAVIPTQFVLFTLSAIAGSAVIYRDFDDDDPAHLSRFAAGCLTEFLGIYLLTSGRPSSKPSSVDNNDNAEDTQTKGWHHYHPDLAEPPSISVRPSTPCSFTSSISSSLSRNQKANHTETTPLLCDRSRIIATADDDEHYHSSVSSTHHSLKRQGSMFCGISLHSQLAGGGMSEDERMSIESRRR
ncbi:magnesium transporter NIPA-domain-containing protein [Phascolomyces articulosus]|uniref:Magnesium transporter NIPA-domain-containing protein n=1 Tax=Phascolomyces articulosus TaxID=60185 RepID=A0AAD5PAM7_9FUNG|nr:magnesium transporter NIPA-domain-containing protein [Phascolomyces articulosus]